MQSWYVMTYTYLSNCIGVYSVHIVSTVLSKELLITENLCHIACGTAIVYKGHFLNYMYKV
jgi:hypothetical protein